ncbi:basic proline-rich protein-like [Canis lupus dingo]|uniref:basic proline-rich protein-like n=2 Tax=Canis lupus TaxID=9612 RepID=UPI0020C2AF97|nr:basic proline-rich protein-like [Canis lupus dingo]
MPPGVRAPARESTEGGAAASAPPPARGLRSPGAAPAGRARSPARRPRGRHHLRQGCCSAPSALPPAPSSLRLLPPGVSPKREEGGPGERKKRWHGEGAPASPGPPPDGRSPPAPGRSRPGPARPGPGPATARSEATEGGRGESPPPAHLPGRRARRLRWRAGRLCRVHASHLRHQLPQRRLNGSESQPPPPPPPPSLRCSRAAPARRPLALGRHQLLARGGGTTRRRPGACGSEAELRKALEPQEEDLTQS